MTTVGLTDSLQTLPEVAAAKATTFHGLLHFYTNRPHGPTVAAGYAQLPDFPEMLGLIHLYEG